jgi:hypothetical protein
MAGLSGIGGKAFLQKRRYFLHDLGAWLTGLLMNEIDHFIELTAGLFHLCIVEVLIAPDCSNLINNAGPTIVHVLGCHGKTGVGCFVATNP